MYVKSLSIIVILLLSGMTSATNTSIGDNITAVNNVIAQNGLFSNIYINNTPTSLIYEPILTQSTNDAFLNGLKQWIILTISNITGLQSTLDSINSTKWNKTDNINNSIQINISQINGLQLLEDTQNTTVNNHIANITNPHNVTASQIGIDSSYLRNSTVYNGSNIILDRYANGSIFINSTASGNGEPLISNGLTTQFWNGLKQWITLGIGNISGLQGLEDAQNTSINNHIANTSNPHNFVESDPTAMGNISSNMAAWLDKYNVTYDAYQELITALQGNDTADRSYVNDTFLKLSGGTMAGNINMGMKNISNVSIINVVNQNTTSINMESSLVNRELFIYKQTQDYDPMPYRVFDVVHDNSNPNVSFHHSVPTFRVYTGTGSLGTYFVGQMSRGNLSTPIGILNGDSIFRVAAAGMRNDGVMSGSRGIIEFVAVGDFSTSNNGEKINFWTTKTGTTGVSIKMTLDDNGDLTINNLAGSGNALTQVDSTGKLGRGNTLSGTGNSYLCWNFTTSTSYTDDLGCS